MSDVENQNVMRAVTRLRTANGDDIMNTWHWVFNGSAADSGVVLAAITAKLDALYDIIQPGIPNDVSFVDIDIANATKREVFAAQDWPALTVGGATGDTMPEHCCALVLGRTNVPKVSGRKFLGPFGEASNVDGAWENGLLLSLGQLAADWMENIVIDGGRTLAPVVARYIGGGALSGFTHLITAVVDNRIAVQRRRKRGVGA